MLAEGRQQSIVNNNENTMRSLKANKKFEELGRVSDAEQPHIG
jgi:hypothetical protein